MNDYSSDKICYIFFQNGWSLNPTPTQFRRALKKLLLHAGKNILPASKSNCLAQDETSLLNITQGSTGSGFFQKEDRLEQPDNCLESFELVANLHTFGCLVHACQVCLAILTYISGYFAFYLSKKIKCEECKAALLHTSLDPCKEMSLISIKNYVEDGATGSLLFPSGSLCQLVILVEQIIRKNRDVIREKQAANRLLSIVLSNPGLPTFAGLSLSHQMTTSVGIDTHYTSLVHLVTQKFIHMRMKKLLKDESLLKRSLGNRLHRVKIFKNL